MDSDATNDAQCVEAEPGCTPESIADPVLCLRGKLARTHLTRLRHRRVRRMIVDWREAHSLTIELTLVALEQTLPDR